MKIKQTTLFFLSQLIICLFFLGCNRTKNQEQSPGTQKILSSNIQKQDATTFETVKNVILLIGDGMGFAQMHVAAAVNNYELSMFKYDHMGMVFTQAANAYITDSAASATAIATGVSTNNGFVGLDPEEKPLKSILKLAKNKGMSTGIVVSTSAVDATPAAFFAQNTKRYDSEAIALDFVKNPPDIFIGGGKKYFTKRKDEKNLFEKLKQKGFEVIEDFETLKSTKKSKIAAFLYDEKPITMIQGRGNFLPLSTAWAIEILKKNKEGFFLMVESAQIDISGHDQDLENLIAETIDFDKTVEKALNFAKNNRDTLVIVTSDHETGALYINGGDMKNNTVEAQFASSDHTGIMVPLFATGPGSQSFTGVYKNTEIFHKISHLLGL